MHSTNKPSVAEKGTREAEDRREGLGVHVEWRCRQASMFLHDHLGVMAEIEGNGFAGCSGETEDH